jgi:hypothetical protein
VDAALLMILSMFAACDSAWLRNSGVALMIVVRSVPSSLL